ncbi:branched-chain amino acid ABC transporter permease [Natronobeatus ordinarius]|uniref:branched-chain amino acid ABC transporter permease n=1 Tax=Natronobeatus ordinarius TaxID=2963433 RepID=UPI0020CBD316|nr:branched-chain amino acid ABC transporter permease [Natronobeatus ordinarius]
MVDTGLSHAVLNGLVTGSFIALGAIGLSLVYTIADVPNFAHGELLMLGAYFALLVNLPGTMPVISYVSGGDQSVVLLGAALLFALTVGGTLGVIYLLGGWQSFRGAWWPIDVHPWIAVAVHVGLALLLGVYVATGVPGMLPAFVLSAVLLAVIAPLFDKYVFRRFREAEASLAVMLIAAMGLAFFLRYTAHATYGGSVRRYEYPRVRSIFGQEINVAAAKYFDFYVSDWGVTFRVTDTAGVVGDPVVTSLEYTWLTFVVLVGATAIATYGGYRWRRSGLGEHEAAQTIGPKMVGSLSGVLVLVVLAVVLAQPGGNPDEFLYATRIRTSVMRLSVIALAGALMIFLHALLKETKLGTAMRAASDNLDLAKATGIDTGRVMMTTWIIAGAYAAVAGVTVGMLFHNIVPSMGFYQLLPMFAAVILGGLASVYGAIVGAYVVGIAMEVGIFTFGFGGVHRVSMAFLVLLIVLLVRPEGIIGR